MSCEQGTCEPEPCFPWLTLALSNYHSSYLWLTRALSLWLTLSLSLILAHSGSFWLTLTQSGSLWLSLTHSGSLSVSLRRSLAHKVLARPATSLLRCHSLSRPGNNYLFFWWFWCWSLVIDPGKPDVQVPGVVLIVGDVDPVVVRDHLAEFSLYL